MDIEEYDMKDTELRPMKERRNDPGLFIDRWIHNNQPGGPYMLVQVDYVLNKECDTYLEIGFFQDIETREIIKYNLDEMDFVDKDTCKR